MGLSQLYTKSDRLAEAEFFLEKLKSVVRPLATNDPLQGHYKGGLYWVAVGEVLKRSRQREEAISAFSKGYQILLDTLGNSHDETAEALSLIAEEKAWNGDVQGALQDLQSSLVVLVKVFGEDHPKSIAIRNLIRNISKPLS